MNTATASERTHCLAPSRVHAGRHAVTGPTSYVRLFPELPALDRTGGNRLGPIGGCIVAQVLIGLIDRDPVSVRTADLAWRPVGNLADLFAWASGSAE